MSFSSVVGKETLPPPRMVSPAFSNSLRAGGDFGGGAAEREMKFLDIDVPDVQLPGIFDGKVALEFTERITGDSELQVAALAALGGGAGRLRQGQHAGSGAEKRPAGCE